MHILLLPLMGLPVAIGFFSLYEDLRKVKNWNIEPDPVAQPPMDALESLAYTIAPIPGGTDLEGLEASVEAIEASAEAGIEAASAGIGHLIESAGHFLPH